MPLTVNAVLVSVQPGAKKANGGFGESAASIEDEGQLFAALLGQWLYGLEGMQGSRNGEEPPSIIPAGKEANSGIVIEGHKKGMDPFLMARGFVQSGMAEQIEAGTGTELDVYKARIVHLLEKLNGQLIIPGQGKHQAELPVQAQAARKELATEVSSLLRAENLRIAEAKAVQSGAIEKDAITVAVKPDLDEKAQFNDSLKENGQAVNDKAEISKGKNTYPENFQDRLAAAGDKNIPDLNLTDEASKDSRQSAAVTRQAEAKDLMPQPEEFEPYLLKDVSAQQEGKHKKAEALYPKTETGMKQELSQKEALTESSEKAKGSELLQHRDRPEKNTLSKPFENLSELSKRLEPGKPFPNAEQPSSAELAAASDKSFVGFGSERSAVAENVILKQIGTETLHSNRGNAAVWERIAEAVREHRNSPEVKELQLQLHPAELGKIRVFLHWQDGQVNLLVHASESATGAMLQQNFSDLRQALEQAGISCGLLESGLGGGDTQQSKPEFSAPTFISRREEEQGKVFLPEQAYGSGDTGSTINYMA